MPFQHASKILRVVFRFLHKSGKPLPVLVSARLHHDRREMFRSQHPGHGFRIARLARLGERLLQQRIVGREELHWHPLDQQTFAFFRASSSFERLADRRQREQPAGGLRQQDEHTQFPTAYAPRQVTNAAILSMKSPMCTPYSGEPSFVKSPFAIA